MSKLTFAKVIATSKSSTAKLSNVANYVQSYIASNDFSNATAHSKVASASAKATKASAALTAQLEGVLATAGTKQSFSVAASQFATASALHAKNVLASARLSLAFEDEEGSEVASELEELENELGLTEDEPEAEAGESIQEEIDELSEVIDEVNQTEEIEVEASEEIPSTETPETEEVETPETEEIPEVEEVEETPEVMASEEVEEFEEDAFDEFEMVDEEDFGLESSLDSLLEEESNESMESDEEILASAKLAAASAKPENAKNEISVDDLVISAMFN